MIPPSRELRQVFKNCFFGQQIHLPPPAPRRAAWTSTIVLDVSNLYGATLRCAQSVNSESQSGKPTLKTRSKLADLGVTASHTIKSTLHPRRATWKATWKITSSITLNRGIVSLDDT